MERLLALRPIIPADLAAGWSDWINIHEALLARAPRLAMADLLARLDGILDAEPDRGLVATWRPRTL